MEFMVSRTSIWSGDKQPCDESYRKEYIPIDVRTVGRPEDIPFYRGKSDWWYDEGINHKVNEIGYIERELEPRNGWFIEIKSLEELLKFKDKYGNIIIRDSYQNYNILEIEIYDCYRE